MIHLLIKLQLHFYILAIVTPTGSGVVSMAHIAPQPLALADPLEDIAPVRLVCCWGRWGSGGLLLVVERTAAHRGGNKAVSAE